MTPKKDEELSWKTQCRDLSHHVIADARGELWKQAWSEWELIQKKIDSVSNFPFTVKTWSMTLAGVAAVAGKAYTPKLPTLPGLLFLASLLLIPIMFYAIEKHHLNIRDTLGKRAHQLEGLLESLDSFDLRLLPGKYLAAHSKRLSQLPGIAKLLISEARLIQSKQYRWKTPLGKWVVKQMMIPNARLFWERFVISKCNGLFYVVQVILLIAIMFLPKQSERDPTPQPSPPTEIVLKLPANLVSWISSGGSLNKPSVSLPSLLPSSTQVVPLTEESSHNTSSLIDEPPLNGFFDQQAIPFLHN